MHKIPSTLLHYLWINPFVGRQGRMSACKPQVGIKHTVYPSPVAKRILYTSVNRVLAGGSAALLLLGRQRGGQPAWLRLSTAVIVFTRQLGHRLQHFDVTVGLLLLRAASWSPLIPTIVRFFKQMKQELDKAVVWLDRPRYILQGRNWLLQCTFHFQCL